MRRLAIVVPTHNRAASLERTLQSLVGCVSDDPATELIVVDNNSTDSTPAVCAAFGSRVTYIEERRQGLSFARNAAVQALHAFAEDDLVAFVDDDIEAAPDWIDAMRRAFDQVPEADCVGGRVLPANPDRFPAWLSRAHWAPLALQDHGDDRRLFDEQHPAGLVGANFAFRKRVFDRLGGFSPAVQRVKDGIGSTEDHEFLRRLYSSGGKALYTPDAVVTTEVPPERLTREYHRRWHRGHGRFHALMRTPEVERTRLTLLGVPAHLIRRALADALTWLRSIAVGDRARAFLAETRLWFFSGFFKERCACLARR